MACICPSFTLCLSCAALRLRPVCALQVWIILELCTGGTLLDAALAGRFNALPSAAPERAGSRMEMVSAVSAAAASGSPVCERLMSFVGVACVPAVTTVLFALTATRCHALCAVLAALAQAKLLSRLLDAASGMAYLHSRGVMHVSAQLPRTACSPCCTRRMCGLAMQLLCKFAS